MVTVHQNMAKFLKNFNIEDIYDQAYTVLWANYFFTMKIHSSCTVMPTGATG